MSTLELLRRIEKTGPTQVTWNADLPPAPIGDRDEQSTYFRPTLERMIRAVRGHENVRHTLDKLNVDEYTGFRGRGYSGG